MTTDTIIPKTRKPSLREKMLATSLPGETVVSQSVGSQGEAVTYTHKSASLVVLYKPTVWGWESVPVPETNVDMCLCFGMREVCGDCGGDCSPNPFSPTPNSCPGRDKFATLRCPECARLFYDFDARVVHPDITQPLQNDEEEAPLDVEIFPGSTPATRLKAAVEAHIARYHDGTARRLGLTDIDGRRMVAAGS